MKGYYIQDDSGKGLAVPTGRLHVEVVNLPEFQELVNRAKQQADQLQETINRLSKFELNIDFSINKTTSSET